MVVEPYGERTRMLAPGGTSPVIAVVPRVVISPDAEDSAGNASVPSISTGAPVIVPPSSDAVPPWMVTGPDALSAPDCCSTRDVTPLTESDPVEVTSRVPVLRSVPVNAVGIVTLNVPELSISGAVRDR